MNQRKSRVIETFFSELANCKNSPEDLVAARSFIVENRTDIHNYVQSLRHTQKAYQVRDLLKAYDRSEAPDSFFIDKYGVMQNQSNLYRAPERYDLSIRPTYALDSKGSSKLVSLLTQTRNAKRVRSNVTKLVALSVLGLSLFTAYSYQNEIKAFTSGLFTSHESSKINQTITNNLSRTKKAMNE